MQLSSQYSQRMWKFSLMVRQKTTSSTNRRHKKRCFAKQCYRLSVFCDVFVYCSCSVLVPQIMCSHLKADYTLTATLPQNVDTCSEDSSQCFVWFVKQVFCVSCFASFCEERQYFLYKWSKEFRFVNLFLSTVKKKLCERREECRSHFVQCLGSCHFLRNDCEMW